MINVGDAIGSSPFNATNNLQSDLQNYSGQWIVLYFYPKDATTGCTTEGQNFRDMHTDFVALNTVIFGVSRDSLKSHENFKAKQAFPFELISDTDEKLCLQFAVIKMKSMYGKQYLGIERSTFLIDPNGVVRHVWRNVKVKGHVQAVYDALVSCQHPKEL